MEPIDLSIWMLFLVFAVTFFSKTYGVIIGGASFVLQPFLLAIGIPPQLAVAHDIAGTNGATVSGVYVFSKSGHIRGRIALWAMPGLAMGPFLGVYLLDKASPEFIENFIAIASVIGCVYLLVKRKSKVGLTEREKPQYWQILTFFYGFAFGTYLGFSGAGGGIAATFFFISVLGLTMTQAIATKRLVHALPFITATIGYLWQGWLQWDLFLAVFLGCLAAGYVGSHLTLKINEKALKIIFLSAAICMAGIILIR